jgi:uncharacterized membrane protein
MEITNFSELTNEALLEEKKKLKKSKIMHAAIIGFLAGILIFGFGAWILSPEKRMGFLIPMFIPILFIYNIVKNSKKNADLEKILKQRGLN